MASQKGVKIKEGFLVKKGHVRHNWKTRWFVLYDTNLAYFKKKTDTACAGEIPLYGCSIVCPCPEYTKKSGVFRLMAQDGMEYLIQAPSEEEMDKWSAAIEDVIKSLESTRRMTASKDLAETYNKILNADLRELTQAMQDPAAGIPIGIHNVDQKPHKHCFTGVQLVDWLLSWSFVTEREDGSQLANRLLKEGHIQAGSNVSRASIKKGVSHTFCDSQDALYRFSALRCSLDNPDADWSDNSSSDSDDEGGTGRTQFSAADLKGQVVKQGILMKKGHVRHNWKTRKFILYEPTFDDPPCLYYCKPVKEDIPVGFIKLKGAEIKMVAPEEKKKNRFMIITSKGTEYLLQSASEDEMKNWVTSLREVLTSKY